MEIDQREPITTSELLRLYREYGFKKGYNFDNWKALYCGQYWYKEVPDKPREIKIHCPACITGILRKSLDTFIDFVCTDCGSSFINKR